MANWYPQDKKELNELVEKLLSQDFPEKNPDINGINNINGIIVPHAGYEYSGTIAGKIYSLVKDKKFKKAIIIAPSHYALFYGICSVHEIKTPFAKAEIIKNKYSESGYEHSVENQIPFLQKIGINKVLPIVLGEISNQEVEKLAKQIIKQKDSETLIVVSTDLSHFLDYKTAVERDKNTIKIIENLKYNAYPEIDACGKLALLVAIEMCLIKKWKPKLIEYKNSGDITGDKSRVVGYAGFIF